MYHQGKLVVDLVGRSLVAPYGPKRLVNDEGREVMETMREYDADSLQCVYSSTKNLTAIAIAVLVDRGLLCYDAAVSAYWPEFAQAGKDHLTVADVLRHDAGLVRLHRRVTAAEAADVRLLCPVVEASPYCPFRSKHTEPPPHARTEPMARGYHAISRGAILSCLLHKVDPAGRDVGTFFREEVAALLGPELAGKVQIGMPPAEQQKHHIADMAPFTLPWSRPDPETRLYLGGGQMRKFRAEGANADGSLVAMTTGFDIGRQNTVVSRRIGNGSASGHANARALGRLAAIMANRGALAGAVLLRPITFEAAHAAVTMKYDEVLLEDARFSAGGFGEFRLGPEFTDRAGSEGRGSIIGGADCHGLGGSFWGWGGAGGSVFLWSPEHRVGLAYTMNGQTPYVLGGPRTKRIFSALCKVLAAGR